MRLLLLNQFGLGSGAPTARILGELGAALAECGHEVIFVSTTSQYGISFRGWRRIAQEAAAHWRMLWKGTLLKRVEAVISFTSPACLAVTADWIARRHGARHFHWIMDLYPDVGERLRELPGGLVGRILRGLMQGAYRRATAVVTLDEDMQVYLRDHYGIQSVVIGPFPPEFVWPRLEEHEKTGRQWLYSGNFGRAHEIEILLAIQKKLEDGGVNAELVLQGQGAQFAASREAASRLGVRQVRWRPPVADDALGRSLLEADVLVVTRKAEMKGLLFPSKLVLAELSGRAVLWIGDVDGRTPQRLRTDGRHGAFAIEDEDSIADWLQGAFQGRTVREDQPVSTDMVRRNAFARWEKLLQESWA